jgi:hypothetical protein
MRGHTALLALLASTASAQDDMGGMMGGGDMAGMMGGGMMGGGMEGMMGGGMEGMMGGGMEGMMGGGGMGGMMGGGMGGGAPPPIEGVRTDLPYIQCATCKALVRRAFYVAKQAREALKSRAPTEEEYLTKLEGICDTEKPSGEWIHSYDLVESEQAVGLKRMPQVGECGVECKTVAMACASTMGEAETDLAEAFYANDKSSKEIEAAVCGAPGKPGSIAALAGECSKAAPQTPEGRAPGEPFAPKLKPPPPMAEAPKKKKKKGKKGKKGKKEEL